MSNSRSFASSAVEDWLAEEQKLVGLSTGTLEMQFEQECRVGHGQPAIAKGRNNSTTQSSPMSGGGNPKKQQQHVTREFRRRRFTPVKAITAATLSAAGWMDAEKEAGEHGRKLEVVGSSKRAVAGLDVAAGRDMDWARRQDAMSSSVAVNLGGVFDAESVKGDFPSQSEASMSGARPSYYNNPVLLRQAGLPVPNMVLPHVNQETGVVLLPNQVLCAARAAGIMHQRMELAKYWLHELKSMSLKELQFKFTVTPEQARVFSNMLRTGNRNGVNMAPGLDDTSNTASAAGKDLDSASSVAMEEGKEQKSDATKELPNSDETNKKQQQEHMKSKKETGDPTESVRYPEPEPMKCHLLGDPNDKGVRRFVPKTESSAVFYPILFVGGARSATPHLVSLLPRHGVCIEYLPTQQTVRVTVGGKNAVVITSLTDPCFAVMHPQARLISSKKELFATFVDAEFGSRHCGVGEGGVVLIQPGKWKEQKQDERVETICVGDVPMNVPFGALDGAAVDESDLSNVKCLYYIGDVTGKPMKMDANSILFPSFTSDVTAQMLADSAKRNQTGVDASLIENALFEQVTMDGDNRMRLRARVGGLTLDWCHETGDMIVIVKHNNHLAKVLVSPQTNSLEVHLPTPQLKVIVEEGTRSEFELRSTRVTMTHRDVIGVVVKTAKGVSHFDGFGRPRTFIPAPGNTTTSARVYGGQNGNK